MKKLKPKELFKAHTTSWWEATEEGTWGLEWEDLGLDPGLLVWIGQHIA